MKTLALIIICALTFACGSEHGGNNNISEHSTLSSQTSNSANLASSPPSLANTSDYDNQMSVGDLRQRLEEIKEIEQEARKMVALRNDWDNGAAECMKIMGRLKPRARTLSTEDKRMLSPAGIEIAGAAMMVNACVNCTEDEDDSDCQEARNSINKSEKLLKKEMRQK